jgi:hypothetical protein
MCGLQILKIALICVLKFLCTKKCQWAMAMMSCYYTMWPCVSCHGTDDHRGIPWDCPWPTMHHAHDLANAPSTVHVLCMHDHLSCAHIRNGDGRG